MKDDIFITTGEWLLQEGAKLVAAVAAGKRGDPFRPSRRQIRLARELRSRVFHWKTQMDRLTDAN